MSSYPPYIPAADADFANWITNFDTLLTANPGTFGLDPADAVIVAGVTATWDAAYLAAIDPATRTTPTIAAKDAARASAEAVIRPYAVEISRSASVTNLDKAAIGVTIPSITPTPIPAPVDPVELGLQSAMPLNMLLSYKVPGSVGKSKPFGSTGVEIWRSVGAVAATDPAQTFFNNRVTKSPFNQNFDAADQGKIVTYFARFTTQSGPAGISQFGPWSPPFVLTVM